MTLLLVGSAAAVYVPLFLEADSASASTPISPVTFTPGTDITAQIQAAVANSQGGSHQGQAGPNEAVITLGGGTYYISSTVNLHASTLIGAGSAHTTIQAKTDFGAGSAMFTGDVSGGHPFEIRDMTIQGPRPPNGVPSGAVPNQMDGVHLMDNCILRKITVNFCNHGVIVDGNHHTLDTVNSGSNWDGLYYCVSSDGSYFDDLIFDCTLCSNGFAGIEVASQMGGSKLVRTHTGFEPYAIYLDHGATIEGCSFDVVQFEGVGNGDIVDADGTGAVNDCSFTECSGWGGEYSGGLTTAPTSPAMRVGTFSSNYIVAKNAMGPAPGSFICSAGCYDNTWICAEQINQFQNGSLAPGIAPLLGCYGNTLQLQGIQAVSYVAQAPITVGMPVQIGTGRTPGVVPATGNAPLLGVSLSTVPLGSICWVAQHGVVPVACDPSANITTGEQVQMQSGFALPEPLRTGAAITEQPIGYAVGNEVQTTHFLSISTAPVEINF